MSNQRLVPLNVAALASAPAGTPKIGDLYYNTTNLKTWVYSSGGWVVAAGGGAAFQTSAPTGPQVGDIWVDSDAAINLLTPDDYALLSGPTFTGPSTVAVNSASTALTIKQTGAGNALVVEDSASPDSTPFVVTADGNVGIGTSSPSAMLNVYANGGNNFTGIASQNSNSGVGIGGIEFGSDVTYKKAAIGLLRQYPNGGGALTFYVDSNTDAAHWSTADEKMRIDKDGNVGIGTTPSVRFDVSGGTARIRNFSGTFSAPSESVDWPIPALNIVSYGNYPLQTMLSFELPNDGNYQTGFTTWNFKLAQTASSTTSAGVAGLQLAGPGYLALGAGGAERMKIDSAGNVGIGTSSPSSRLHVHGSGITFTDGNGGTSMQASAYSLGYNMIGPNPNGYTSWAVYTPSGVGMGVAVNEAASTVELYARNNGTQMYGNGQLRFNPGGQITMANQPVFWAGRTSGDVTGPAVIPFNEVRLNRGSNYSTATGRFTAPVAGIYSFSAGIMFYNAEPTAILRLNAGHMVYDYQELHSSYAGWWHNNLNLVTIMAAGDYVDVYNYGTGPAYGVASVHTWFSGFLLG